MRILVVILVLVSGCGPSMMDYAQAKYPRCDVEKVDSDTVLVRCPGEEPFEKDLKAR